MAIVNTVYYTMIPRGLPIINTGNYLLKQLLFQDLQHPFSKAVTYFISSPLSML